MDIRIVPYRSPGVYSVINNDWGKYKLVMKYDNRFIFLLVINLYTSINNDVSAKSITI